jgi:uncharacterized repeat protein (TIGR01451 family)
MLKIRFALVAALGLLAVVALGATTGGAARFAPQANVTIHLAATPQPAAVDSDLTYTLTVRNWGPQRARAVLVRDRLPAGTTFVSATSSKGSCAGAALVSCSLGALARGGIATVKIVVRPTQDGRITNHATVQAFQRDPARWNNSASLSLVVGPAANLGLGLLAAPRPATVGQPLTYTLTVRNLSSVDATGVVLTDRIPARSMLVSATPSQGSCTGAPAISCALGTIAAGASAQVTIVVQPTSSGYLTNRASVKSDHVDPARANNTRTAIVRVKPAS